MRSIREASVFFRFIDSFNVESSKVNDLRLRLTEKKIWIFENNDFILHLQHFTHQNGFKESLTFFFSVLYIFFQIIKKRDYIIVGVKTDSPPFGYYDKNDKLVGFAFGKTNTLNKTLCQERVR